MPHRPAELRSARLSTLRFARLRGSTEQAIYGGRGIINLQFTCPPGKNCPPPDRAAAFFQVLFWCCFSFLSPYPRPLIPFKSLPPHWLPKSQPLRSPRARFFYPGRNIH